MEFIKNVLKPSYWIAHQNIVPDVWIYSLYILFGILILIGLVGMVLASTKKLRKPYRNLFFKLSVWGWVMGLYGLTQLFFAVQQIWILSSRGFWLLWLAIAIWWLYSIILYGVKDVPRLIASHNERVQREKYLPKRKK